MKPPAFSALARWLPALAVWSAVLLSLFAEEQGAAHPILAGAAAVPCVPLHLAGSAG